MGVYVQNYALEAMGTLDREGGRVYRALILKVNVMCRICWLCTSWALLCYTVYSIVEILGIYIHPSLARSLLIVNYTLVVMMKAMFVS